MMPTKWVEVDTEALKANCRAVRSRAGTGVRLIAVVKANGYGHGLALAARAFIDAGAEMLAVTTLEEGIALRESGVRVPILLFAPSLPDSVDLLLDNDLTATVCDSAQALALSRTALHRRRRLRVHLKVDVGMGRVGCFWMDAPSLTETLRAADGLHLEGVYTHFSTAFHPNGSLFRQQRVIFNSVLDALTLSGARPPLVHAANSAAFLADPGVHYDAVRVGTILYGQTPPGVPAGNIELSETWKLCCRIVQVRDLPPGWTVGYAAEWTTDRATRIAVLPLGYADGLTVEPASLYRSWRGVKRWIGQSLMKRGLPHCLIAGKRAPILGRIAAQMVCADVTDIPEARPGAVAELPARRALVSADIPRIPKADLAVPLS